MSGVDNSRSAIHPSLGSWELQLIIAEHIALDGVVLDEAE